MSGGKGSQNILQWGERLHNKRYSIGGNLEDHGLDGVLVMDLDNWVGLDWYGGKHGVVFYVEWIVGGCFAGQLRGER